ncbi:MAG TPA: thiamine phosphate synthase [Sphingobacterium sp.]|nr:thiamine phosphate synthase [Sphingobacterium sp.]
MKKNISKGVYLVIDSSMDKKQALNQLKAVKNEKIAAIQIWNNPVVEKVDKCFLKDIVQLYKDVPVPILINEEWELLKEIDFDGVHFDNVPSDFPKIKQELDREFLKGITLSNDLEAVEKADKFSFDYVSFCSMFPSKTVDSCEIVHPDSVKKCRAITSMPIFLSGGINPDNMGLLQQLPFEGVAVVSGIMKATDPVKALRAYNKQLRNKN